jgi:hypothetical protein
MANSYPVLGGFARQRSPLAQYQPVLYQSLVLSILSSGSLICDPQSQKGHRTCIPPTHEPVNPLISTSKISTVEITSHSEIGNRSSIVRHLIWLRNGKGFQDKVRVRISLLCTWNFLFSTVEGGKYDPFLYPFQHWQVFYVPVFGLFPILQCFSVLIHKFPRSVPRGLTSI